MFSVTQCIISMSGTLDDQVGRFAKYVLEHELTGVFHVGSTDMVDWYDFHERVCKILDIQMPEYDIEYEPVTAYQAVLPGRREIPKALHVTVSQVLEAIRGGVVRRIDEQILEVYNE